MKGRYYWLKLQNNFFEQAEIRMLLAMANGTKYVIIYLKLLLKSVETEGFLIFKKTIPYTPEMIAYITGEDIDTVRSAIDIFISFKLMDSLENGALFMNEIQNMLGSESKWAEIKRNQREEKKLIQESSNMKKDEEKEILQKEAHFIYMGKKINKDLDQGSNIMSDKNKKNDTNAEFIEVSDKYSNINSTENSECSYSKSDFEENYFGGVGVEVTSHSYDRKNYEDNVQEMSEKSLIEKDIDSELKKKINKNKIYMDLTFIDDIIENVKITEDEYNKLVSKHCNVTVNTTILKLDNYIVNGKKKYKDHYRVINTWCLNNTKSNSKISYGKNNENDKSKEVKSRSHDMFAFD